MTTTESLVSERLLPTMDVEQPIRCRRRRYIRTVDQSDAGGTGARAGRAARDFELQLLRRNDGTGNRTKRKGGVGALGAHHLLTEMRRRAPRVPSWVPPR
eukprot:2069451-Pyramimonas_sp.AAC.1